jgi:hypothetical protein
VARQRGGGGGGLTIVRGEHLRGRLPKQEDYLRDPFSVQKVAISFSDSHISLGDAGHGPERVLRSNVESIVEDNHCPLIRLRRREVSVVLNQRGEIRHGKLFA